MQYLTTDHGSGTKSMPCWAVELAELIDGLHARIDKLEAAHKQREDDGK